MLIVGIDLIADLFASIVTSLPVDFYQKTCMIFKLIIFDICHILDYLQFQQLCFLKPYLIVLFQSNLYIYHKPLLKTSLIKIIPVSMICISCLHFLILSLFLVNGPQALKVKPGCFKCISGINLSPANKNVFTISFIVYKI